MVIPTKFRLYTIGFALIAPFGLFRKYSLIFK